MKLEEDEILEGEIVKPSDQTINKINNMAELYAKIFKAIHTHEYLSKLDTGLKKDIATSFFIEYNKR